MRALAIACAANGYKDHMLRDYRDWLEAEAAGGNDFAKRVRDRFERETENVLCVEIERPLARRVLTSLELIDQQSTALRPEFDALRNAIRTAFDQALFPEPEEREPLEETML